MDKYTFYAEGLGIEISVTATSQKEAHRMAAATLTDDQMDALVSLDWIDTEPA